MYVVCFEFILSPVGDDILEGGAQFLSAGFVGVVFLRWCDKNFPY